MSSETPNNRSRKRPSPEPLDTTTSKRARVEDYVEDDAVGEFSDQPEIFESIGDIVESKAAEPDDIEDGEILLAEWMSESDKITATIYNRKRKHNEEGESSTAKRPCYWSDEDLNCWAVRTPWGEVFTGSFPTGVEPSVMPPNFVVPVPKVLLEEPKEPEKFIVPVPTVLLEEEEKEKPEEFIVPIEHEERAEAPEPAPAAVFPHPEVQSILAAVPAPEKVTFFFTNYTEEELQGIREVEPEKVNVPQPTEQPAHAPAPEPRQPQVNVPLLFEQLTAASKGVSWADRIGTKPVQAEPVRPKPVEPKPLTAEEEAKIWEAAEKELARLSASTAASSEYKEWHKLCTLFFTNGKKFVAANHEKLTYLPFPRIRPMFCTAIGRDCVRGDKLGICQHDVERVLKGSGIQMDGAAWLKWLGKERLNWHTDRFKNWVGKKWEPEAREMFQMIQALIDKEKN